MTAVGWLQVLFLFALVLAVTRPLGAFMYRVLEGRAHLLQRPLGWLERLVYRICGVDGREQSWQVYATGLLVFSAITMLVTFLVQRLQHVLPLNPQRLGPVEPLLAFNTAASFTTNTNWQSYAGETTMSYLTQMAGLAWHNFISAAAGIAVAVALSRGLTRRGDGRGPGTVGNLWVDLTRSTVYILLPLSLVIAMVFVSQGAIQSFSPYQQITTLENAHQLIPMGPVASQEAIKQLGTNGGGFFNANAAHPFENPSPMTNFLSMLLIFAIPAGLTFTFGRMASDQRQGWALFAAMAALFFAGVAVAYWAEAAGTPERSGGSRARAEGLGGAVNPERSEGSRAGVEGSGGAANPVLGLDGAGHPERSGGSRARAEAEGGAANMEGKEVRFGVAGSALYATVTTDASCGAVNSVHDSFTPIGGLVTLFNIQLGEVVFGGVGAGLYGMLVLAILAVFIAGLMVGRTPEYLGKKLETREVKLAMLFVLVSPLTILALAAVSMVTPSCLASLGNGGPHGLTEVLYAFSSAVGNNGSAFVGLNANTPWYNLSLAVAMLVGRFWMMIPALAISGLMAGKRVVPPGPGTFPTSGPLFVLLLIGVIVVVGALTFLPALSLGPIAEHLLARSGRVF